MLVRVGRNPDSRLHGEVSALIGLQARQCAIAAMRQGCAAIGLFACAAEVNEEAGASSAGLAERGRRRPGNFDGAVEEIFAGGEELELRAECALAEIVRGVGIEAEVAVEEIGVGVVVKLTAAEAALEAKGSERRTGGAQVKRGQIAGDFRNPIAEVLRAARDHGVRVLVAAVDGEPGAGREFEIQRDAATLDLTEIPAHEQNG